MGLFVPSASSVRRTGVFAVEAAPPRIIEGVSNGFIGLVAQFAWGPENQVYQPEGGADFLNRFEPVGSPRNSTGYYAVMGRKKAPWKVVRVLGAGAVAALDTAAGTLGNMVSTAKYKGTLGNSIVRTISAAASGDATKRDVKFTLTDPVTGTLEETYRDVPLPAGGVAVSLNVASSKLLASVVLAGTMTAFPANGSANLATGTNGAAVGTADYTGTEGLADKGVALFEAHPTVRVVCHDDCGDANRAAINLKFASHCSYMGNRIAMMEGNVGAADWAAVKAYVTGGLVADRVVFNGAWVQALDDAGIARTGPLSTFAATVIVNSDPQNSHARWADDTTDFYQNIVAIVSNFSTASEVIQDEAKDLGIALPIQLESGRFAITHDRNASQTSGKKYTIRRRITDFLVASIKAALPAYINSPNVVSAWKEIKAIVDNFLSEQKRLGRIVAFSTDIVTSNTASTTALGQFFLDIDVQTPSPMEQIFIQINASETVTVREAA